MIAQRLIAAVFATALLAATLPTAAVAQSGEANFWLKGSPNNIQGCIGFDPQFTRKHTFNLINGVASIAAPGGINTKLTLVRPDVYETRLQLDRLNMHIVADLAATPKTLKITDSNMGCSWSAVKD